MKKILFIFFVSLLLSGIAFLITCKNSPVMPVDEPVMYGTIFAVNDAARAGIIIDRHHPDQCLENSFTVNDKKLEEGSGYHEYYAIFEEDEMQLPDKFVLSADFCGNLVTASTRLCDTFSIVAPKSHSHYVSGQPLEIIWTAAGEGFKYAVYVERLYPDLTAPVLLSESLVDTAFIIPKEILSDHLISIWVICYEHGFLIGNSVFRMDENNLTGMADGFFGSYRIETILMYPE